jgi:hypothetical protein
MRKFIFSTRRVAISIIAAGSILMAVTSTASALRFIDVFQQNCAANGGRFSTTGNGGTILVCAYKHGAIWCDNIYGSSGACGIIGYP